MAKTGAAAARPDMYRDKVILAPMVRVGTLPTRLLALDYGADLVYTEETIDYKMVTAKRIENDVLETVDFVTSDGFVAFRTCEKEHSKVVFQMGTADAQRALQVARMVEKDVAAIDINMGCPKEFSIKGGMGAALLTKPEKIKEILTTLVNGLSIPVTCKVRILPKVEESIELVRMIESTGVSAVGVHGRLMEERPQHKNRTSTIKAIAEAVNIPVIANGGSKEIKTYEDIAKFRTECGAASVMLARAAQWNTSIFRPEGMLHSHQVIKDYLKYAVYYNHDNMSNTKCVLQYLLHTEMESKEGKALQASANLRDFCAIWGMEAFYDDVQEERRQKELRLKRHLQEGDGSGVKKRKLEDGTELMEMPVKYDKRAYPNKKNPKMTLYEWTVREKMSPPKYESVLNKEDRTYYSTVTINDKKYASTYWDKSKKYGEQASAVVCLHVLGLELDDVHKKVAPTSQIKDLLDHVTSTTNQNKDLDHVTSTANQNTVQDSPTANQNTVQDSPTANQNTVQDSSTANERPDPNVSGVDQITQDSESIDSHCVLSGDMDSNHSNLENSAVEKTMSNS